MKTPISSTLFGLLFQNFMHNDIFVLDNLRFKKYQIVLRPATSASTGSLLKMQLLRPHPTPTESEILGRCSVCFTKSPEILMGTEV